MEMVGKYLVIWMPSLKMALREILSIPMGDDDLPEGGHTIVGGQVVGVNQLGVWVELKTISTLAPNEEWLLHLPDGETRPDQLIRWDLIRNASLFKKPPTANERQRVFGFVHR